jgi:hypothetical protein
MSYLAMFLSQHARPNSAVTQGAAELTKLPKAPFVSSVSASSAHVPLYAGIDEGLEHGLAVREVLGFPAVLLCSLSVPTALVLAVPGVDCRVSIATHIGCARAMFGPNEWRALILGAETGRACLADVRRWCERKQHEPNWHLPRNDLTGVVRSLDAWTVDMVLQRLGVRLRAVVLEGGEPDSR